MCKIKIFIGLIVAVYKAFHKRPLALKINNSEMVVVRNMKPEVILTKKTARM